MRTFKKTALTAGLVTAMVGGTLALSAAPASADVACNRYGECWHVREHYNNYPANLRIGFHDDVWWKAHQRHYHWRKDRDDDHGYYMHGRWRAFER